MKYKTLRAEDGTPRRPDAPRSAYLRVAIVWCATVLAASAVTPTLNTILPRGGQRGQEVAVQIRGKNLSDIVDMLFTEPGLEVVTIAPTPDKPNQATATLRVAPDCRIGLHAVRVRTKTGLSNLRLFSVGNLTEFVESEPNNSPDEADEVEGEATINGRVPNEDVDYYAVTLEKGQRLTVEAEAIRLGLALFDIKLRLFSPHGHELLAEDDTSLLRQDAAFTITADEPGRYLVAVSESTYGGNGNYYYRLHLGAFPRPLSVTPLGGKAGAETEVTWLGDPSLMTQPIVVPAVSPGTRSLLPANDAGFAPSPVPFRVSPFSGVSEVEPNNTKEEATTGQAPGAFDGVISEDGDTDWYQFEGKKDQKYDIRLWARELGSPLDGVMSLVAPSGTQLANDDDARGMDSYFRVTLPEDGTYAIWVADHLRRGGETYAYRVEVTPIEAKLSFTTALDKTATLALPQGNRRLLILGVSRSEFDGDIALEFNDLPAGVRVEHAPLLKGMTRLPVIFHTAADAAQTGGLIDIRGSHEAITGTFDQRITLVTGRNQVVFIDHPVDRLATAVIDPAPFEIHIKETKVPIVKRGQKRLRVVATRAEGFTAAIKLRMPYLPGTFGSGTATIAADETEADILLEAKGNAPEGPVTVVVEAESEGWVVCTPFTPVDVTKHWVKFAVEPLGIEQGQQVEIVAKVTQNIPYEGTFSAELGRLPKGVSSEPQNFTKETTELRFPLTVAADAPTGKFPSLRVSTVLDIGGEPISHGSGGAELKIFAPLPPELQQAAKPPPAPEEKKKAEEAPKRRTRFPGSQ